MNSPDYALVHREQAVDSEKSEPSRHVSFTAEQPHLKVLNGSENSIAETDEDVKSENSPSGNSVPDEEEVIITQADIDILRTLPPRKSVLNFTEKEKSATLRWAARFKADIGEKSPYFRADSEWRDSEENVVPVIAMEDKSATFNSIKGSIKSKEIPREIIINADSKWDIQISRRGLEDTINYASKHNDNVIYNALYSIGDVVKNAILLDTTLSEKNNQNKAYNTMFMHKMYGIIKLNNDYHLLKLTVEEFFDGINSSKKRMYNLQDIKSEPLRHLTFTENNQLALSVLNGSEISIADLFALVKACDKDFYMNSPDYALVHREQAVGDENNEPSKAISFADEQLHSATFNGSENSIAETDEDVKSENSPSGNSVPDEEEVIITQADIDILRTLPPRKSVLNFTEEEKSATLRWAARFKADIGEKSPYFRADGEWRDSEESKTVSIINISNINATFKKADEDVKLQAIPRGTVTNDDTKWDIQISRRGLGDTLTYARRHKDVSIYNSIYSIDEIIKNSILLDTILSEKNNNNKANNTAFMHKLYTIIQFENELYIAKSSVEEMLNDKKATTKRLYNLQDIKIEPLRHAAFADKRLALSVLNGSEISIADLFALVKACDKDFYMNSPDYALVHREQAVDSEKSEPSRHIEFTENQLARSVPDGSENSITETGEDVKREFNPVTVTCEFSESPVFEEGRVYTVAEFDRMMKEADTEKCEGWEFGVEEYGSAEEFERKDEENFYKYVGYDKVEFTINLPNGDTITERQDIGDGYGGFIDFLKQFPKFAAIVEIVEAQRDLDNAVRERDELKEKTETLEIDYNAVQAEQLSFFSAAPERKSIDEVIPELSDIVSERKTGRNIAVGDKFTYMRKEYTITSLDGLYPNDVSVSYTSNAGSISYVTGTNVDRDVLAEQGIYLGNINDKTAGKEEPAENSPMGNNSPAAAETDKINFRITDDDFNASGGAKTRFRNNVEAIKLLKKIESEGRTATAEEQTILAKYVGWGGISQAFSHSANWEKEHDELLGLLTKEEYSNARASVLDAYYTSPVVVGAMYAALDNMGFSGGKILEPAMGTGNFFGTMPETILNNSQLTGIEIDSISGRIAKQLYQTADISVKPYQHTHFANDSFDVAIGNVPFGDSKPYDKEYCKYNFNVHDYFFAKTLDQVRPGGIIAFVTSQGTLDKKSSDVRSYIAERAELLGAIRLPNNAFKGIAGTEVTSDIIFLQKRERPVAIDKGAESWLNRGTLENGVVVNNYFVEHPEMILGKMVTGNKMYGRNDSTMCVPFEGADLKTQLAAAIENITGTYQARSQEEKEVVDTVERIAAPADSRSFSFVLFNDKLYYREDDETMTEVTGKQVERIKAMTDIRDTVRQLLDLQISNINNDLNDEIAEKRTELNAKYDTFVEKYVNISAKNNAAAYKQDNAYHLIKSLEVTDDDGIIRKADIFTKDTIKPIAIAEKVDNAHDALILSLSEKLKVDLEFMQKITGMTEERLISELKEEIFQNPEKNMQWESADEYLTGNVRKKLAAAENAGLEYNAQRLHEVIPERIEAEEISVKLGASWIDPEYIRQFIIEEFNLSYSAYRNLQVTYEPYSDTWGITGFENKSSYYCTAANETYGNADGRNNGYKIIEMALNNKKPQIYKDLINPETGEIVKDVKGKPVRVVDPQATAIIQNKQNQVKKKFAEWIMSDPDRREKLVTKYNEIFNAVRLREYDGSHLHFVGMSSEIELKPHQKNAVARALYNGNTLFAHEVGAGKTFEMIATVMEGKRLGLHNKALCAVPKHLTEQMGNAFRELYPNCNILVATEKDFEKQNRQQFLAKIATGDYDAIIMGHTQFDRIHLSKEREKQYIIEELEELRAAMDAIIDDDGSKSFTVKQIEKTVKKYEKELSEIEDRSDADDFIDFEQLGIDKILIDESQNYKNLSVATKMQNIAGLGSEGSKKSMHLLSICRYLDELTGSKGVIFASGTPISNSMTELYSISRYLQADKLKEMGLGTFDRWASVFGETKTEMELKPTANGEYQMKTRFAKFANLPELMNMFKEVADVKTADTLDLPRPECERHIINVPPSRFQKRYIKSLGERAEAIQKGDVDPHIDNMLKITTDGRKIGLDARCIDPNAPDDPNSKVNVCINNVFDIWQKTAENKSTQLIFCDISTPQNPKNENGYVVYRKGADGEYNAIYSGKLPDKDNIDSIFRKLADNPPKDFIEEIGTLRDDDVIVTRRVFAEEETAYHDAAFVSDSKLVKADEQLWNDLHITPVSTFESEKRFCVYDDIKDKLIKMGVPEEEIAFIHDYEKPEDKQKLFDRMNKGEVRIMIGSTSKCGAGMNAQERMIALHDLDAPMRPSDMGQRRGRIERQGNTNPKVDIFRYTTDRTFDAYLYQMLENKQKFISQIMTEKAPVRICEDIDEQVLDYAETKALCAGNPLIKERLDLKIKIEGMNNLKTDYLKRKYKLQDSIKYYPAQLAASKEFVRQLESDVKRIKPLLEDADGKKYAPITVNGKTYTDKEEGGTALRDYIMQNLRKIYDGKELYIGSYRGFELSVLATEISSLTDGNSQLKLCLTGDAKHYCDVRLDSDITPTGNITRLNNAISGIEDKELVNARESLERFEFNHTKTLELIEVPFDQEEELAAAEKRLEEVETELMTANLTDNAELKDLYETLVAFCPDIAGNEDFYRHYESQGYEPLTIERNGDEFVIMHTYTQNGDLMYDPAITFTVDNENGTIDITSFEQSGTGTYEYFDETNIDSKNDCIEFFGQWLENIENQGFELSEKEISFDEEIDEPDMPNKNNNNWDL